MTDFTPGPINGRIPDGFVTDAEPLPRRPTTSLPEPAEESLGERLIRNNARVLSKWAREDAEALQGDADEFVPAYSAVETAKHYAELADMVAVPKMTESEAQARAVAFCNAPFDADAVRGYISGLRVHGIIRPDPTPLDIAKAELPHVSAEDIERIAAIVKGETNV